MAYIIAVQSLSSVRRDVVRRHRDKARILSLIRDFGIHENLLSNRIKQCPGQTIVLCFKRYFEQ